MYKILQIEDLPSDAYLVKREIRKVLDPCEFRIVDEKEAFLQELKNFKPDIIISDFSIPGFSWNTALMLTRQVAPHTPFIIVTGSTSDEIRSQCMEAGATAFISKNALNELAPVIMNAIPAK